MSITNKYPKSRPSGIYNVINGRPELPVQSEFTRATEATYVDKDGVIKVAAIDEPRFSYDRETGEFLGLLLEPASTNQAFNSALVRTNTEDRPDGWRSLNPNAIPTGVVPIDNIVPGGGPAYISAARYANGGGFRTPLPDFAPVGGGNDVTFGAWIRKPSAEELEWFKNNNNVGPEADGGRPWTASPGVKFSTRIGTSGGSGKDFYISDEWQYISWTDKASNLKINNDPWNFAIAAIAPSSNYKAGAAFVIGSVQVEQLPAPSSFIITPVGDDYTREADSFTLTSTEPYDQGFSLLLDSETTTEDFVYQITDTDDNEVSTLGVENGVLEWDIGGVSNQSQGEYPQVGFVNGRVRTVSSFGAADGDVQLNYLYTTGISFPTSAAVPAGASKITFGTPQTLKALYLWIGQLDNEEAVSLIKGEYNIVSPEDDIDDALIFAYNTDPTDVGTTEVSWPSIQPNTSDRFYFGDGVNKRFEPGVDPSHEYPYPGVYKVQVEADDGFSELKLADVKNGVYEVIQWPPEYRVDAPGDGFTGDDLALILYSQGRCESVPQFKYTDLTDINNAFYGATSLDINNWNWVPTELQECTNMGAAFWGSMSKATTEDKSSFPQLKTSDKLLTATSTFRDKRLTGFVDSDGIATNMPFTNTSSVTNFISCFYNCRLTNSNLVVDTSAATSVSQMFGYNRFVTSPFFDTSLVQNFSTCFANNPELETFTPLNLGECVDMSYAFNNCPKLDNFPSNINISKVTNFNNTWSGCESLTSFPLIDTSKVTNFKSAWQNCSSLTSFPLIDTSSGTNFDSTWRYDSALTSFPLIDTSSATYLAVAWSDCSGLTSFPLIDTSSVTSLYFTWAKCTLLNNIGVVPGATTSFPLIETSSVTSFAVSWSSCRAITVFPLLDTSSGTIFNNCWQTCSSLDNFPSLDFSVGTNFAACWDSCTSLTSFPANMFDTTGTLISTAFDSAWKGCALTPQSIENIFVSLAFNAAKGVNTSVALSVNAGTNAPRYAGSSGTGSDSTSWNANTEAKFQELLTAGWTITYNKYVGVEDTLPATFYVFHGPDAVHFVETTTTVESGQPNQEMFEVRDDAARRAFELNFTGFREFSLREEYEDGEYVTFRDNLYRATAEVEPYVEDDSGLDPDPVIPTPANDPKEWILITYEEESDGGPV